MAAGAPREAQYRLTRQHLVRYAGASGDFNPIHTSDRAAAARGLPGVLAHGMLTMALVGRMLTDTAGGDPAAVTEVTARFSGPVVVPDTDEGVVVSMTATLAGPAGGGADGTAAVTVAATVDEVPVLTRAGGRIRVPADAAADAPADAVSHNDANPPAAGRTP
jgi:acyl dehydratase